jgi:type IV secretory pathway TrbD component
MLNGELTEEFIEELTTWGEKIMGLVMWFIDAKKK